MARKKASKLKKRSQISLRFYLNIFFVLLGVGTFFYWGWHFFIEKEMQTPILYPTVSEVRTANAQQPPPSLTPTVINHTFSKSKKNTARKPKEVLLPENSFETQAAAEDSAEDLVELVLSSQFYQIGSSFADLKSAKKYWKGLQKHEFLQNRSISFHQNQEKVLIVLECPYTESAEFLKNMKKHHIKAVLLENP
jgi:hypothetical protein